MSFSDGISEAGWAVSPSGRLEAGSSLTQDNTKQRKHRKLDRDARIKESGSPERQCIYCDKKAIAYRDWCSKCVVKSEEILNLYQRALDYIENTKGKILSNHEDKDRQQVIKTLRREGYEFDPGPNLYASRIHQGKNMHDAPKWWKKAGKECWALRRAHNLKQNEVEKATDLPIKTVSLLENGFWHELTKENAEKILTYLRELET